jgi:serine/threonine protein kinase
MADSTLFSAGLSVAALDKKLANYDVVRVIGHGAMGIVYEARQKGVGRRVAIKVLPPNLALRERTVKRFLREAESMGRLAHANIVDVYEVGSLEDLHYFTMQYVEGPPLDRVIAAGPLAIGDVVRIGIEIADALAHAHARGVLHRDVKPSNLLRDGERVMLTDFGLARPLDSEDGGAMTEQGDLVGTPLYMSPEQIAGEGQKIDGRADVWGLGATLYELCAQRPPFTGRNAQGILHAILHRDPPLLHRLRKDAPPDLEAVLLKCLEKDLARRYSGAAALLDDLRAVQEGRQVSARPPRFFDPFVRWARRHPLEASVAAASLVVIAFLGQSSLRSRKSLETSQAELEQAKTEKQQVVEDRRIERQGMTLANARAELWRAHADWETALREERREEQEAVLERMEHLKEAFPPDRHPAIAAEAMRVYASMVHGVGRDAEMLEYFEQMIADEKPATALALRAAMLTGRGLLDEALAVHEQRTLLDPRDPEPYLDMAVTLRLLAEETLRAELPLDHKSLLTRALLPLREVFRRAVFYESESVRREDAVQFGQGLMVSALIEEARILIGLGQLDAASAKLEQALEHDSTRADARMLLVAADAERRQAKEQRPAPGVPAPPPTALAAAARSTGEATEAAAPLSGLPLVPATLDLSTTARELQSAGKNLLRIYTGFHDILQGAIREEATAAPKNPP